MSDQLRAGVVGLSGIGERPAAPGAAAGWGLAMPHSHVSAYHHVGDTELVAVCDISEDAIANFNADWSDDLPEVNTYTSHREMLEKENLDILSVVTGDNVHAQIAVDGVNAGVKGILCEKPIASSLADADRIIEAVTNAGIPLLVDHSRRWMFPWVQAAKLIEDGAIGDVKRVVANQGGARAMLFRNGTHMCDTINWFAQGNPTAIYAVNEIGFEDYGPRYASDGGHDPDTDPAVSILIEYDNDVRAFWNMCKPMPGLFDVDVFGSKGVLRVSQERATISHETGRREMATVDLSHTQYTQGHIAGAVVELIDLIRNGGTPSCGPKESRQVMEVLLGALQSSAGGNVRVSMPITDM
jgi:UDP-N-acetylglucosamine 3-dehydrogenase